MQLLNIFHSGGLWILPFAMYIVSFVLFGMAAKASKSGSVTGGSYADPTIRSSNENVSITQTWPFKFGIGLFIVATVALIWIASDYKGV